MAMKNDEGTWYCPMCDTVSKVQYDCQCKPREPMQVKSPKKEKQPDIVGISAEDEMKRACADPDYYNKEIWNAAIEAAAELSSNWGDRNTYQQSIRKLKK